MNPSLLWEQIASEPADNKQSRGGVARNSQHNIVLFQRSYNML